MITGFQNHSLQIPFNHHFSLLSLFIFIFVLIFPHPMSRCSQNPLKLSQINHRLASLKQCSDLLEFHSIFTLVKYIDEVAEEFILIIDFYYLSLFEHAIN